MATTESRIVHIAIERDWRTVYEFASRPEAMPQWASGLAWGLEKDGNDWVANGPLGTIRIRFSPENDFGILDHTVFLPSGQVVTNAMRVIPNGDGAEVLFALLRLADVTDEHFASDAAWVDKDLRALKALMEKREG